MGADLFSIVGGLGLFLIGMAVMTDGLRALAGEAFNRVLRRCTRSPASGALTGALATALVQSSSATTVAAVGFVNAGLMTFPQALGIIFGANLGSTITGWLVALLGFKLALGTMAMPVLLAGALLRLLGRGRLARSGWAVAGFALLFLGIELMREGAEPLLGLITPDRFPADSLEGRLLLLLLGVLVTAVTRSSSAGVAMALTAVHAGALSFPQAAALVIGMDVGTTSNAALATVGGSCQSRRTGLAHVVYNLLTAVMALLLLDVYPRVVAWLVEGGVLADPELALVGFHTAFNGLGVVAVLPFARPFARLMERLVPERGAPLTRRLDEGLLVDPSAAALALSRTVRDLSVVVFGAVRALLGAAHGPSSDHLDELGRAVAAARAFAGRVRTGPGPGEAQRRHLAALHVLDHLDRLLDRCRQGGRAATVRGDRRLAPAGTALSRALVEVEAGACEDGYPLPVESIKAVRDRLKPERHAYRDAALGQVTSGAVSVDAAIAGFDAVRWLHRVAYHAWRITLHLQRAEERAPPPGVAPDEIPPSRELDPGEDG